MVNYIASVPTLGEAQCVSRESRQSLKQGGFRLTRFLSNNKLALHNIPCEDHDKIKTSTRVLGQNLKLDSGEFFADLLLWLMIILNGNSSAPCRQFLTRQQF